MSTITVGAGEQYSTIAAAIAASSSGDTIDVDAGTYTNDFINISHSLTLIAVGGTVDLVATTAPPNGKGIIDEGGSGVAVRITGFDISGASVADGNGAGIRYEGGTLTLNNDTVHGNQDGLLANADPAGTITINNSTFTGNGTGDGYTHNIYVDAIASLTVENSIVTNAIVGHDIKSRAASTTIRGDTITDGTTGTASYEIDLPNAGVAVINNNVIEKGTNAQNPIVISFGEEGSLFANSSLTVAGNTILNNDPSSSATVVANNTGVTATVSNNSVYGFTKLTFGPVAVTATTILANEPALSSLTVSDTTASGTTSSAPTPTTVTPTDTTASGTTPPGTTTSTPAETAAANPAATDVTTTDADASNTAAIDSSSVWASATPTAFLSSTTGSGTDQSTAPAAVTDGQTATTASGLSDAYSTSFVAKGTPHPDPIATSIVTVYAPAALNQQVTSGATPDTSVYPS